MKRVAHEDILINSESEIKLLSDETKRLKYSRAMVSTECQTEPVLLFSSSLDLYNFTRMMLLTTNSRSQSSQTLQPSSNQATQSDLIYSKPRGVQCSLLDQPNSLSDSSRLQLRFSSDQTEAIASRVETIIGERLHQINSSITALMATPTKPPLIQSSFVSERSELVHGLQPSVSNQIDLIPGGQGENGASRLTLIPCRSSHLTEDMTAGHLPPSQTPVAYNLTDDENDSDCEIQDGPLTGICHLNQGQDCERREDDLSGDQIVDDWTADHTNFSASYHEQNNGSLNDTTEEDSNLLTTAFRRRSRRGGCILSRHAPLPLAAKARVHRSSCIPNHRISVLHSAQDVGPTEPDVEFRIDPLISDQLYRSSCSIGNFGWRLTCTLYTIDELRDRNFFGNRGKAPLSPRRRHAIEHAYYDRFAEDDTDAAMAEGRTAINQGLRNMTHNSGDMEALLGGQQHSIGSYGTLSLNSDEDPSLPTQVKEGDSILEEMERFRERSQMAEQSSKIVGESVSVEPIAAFKLAAMVPKLECQEIIEAIDNQN